MTLCHYVRVSFESVTGLAADRFLNDLAFKFDGDPDPADFDGLRDEVIAFYNDNAPSPAQNIASYISREAVRTAGASSIDIYEVPDAPAALGSPVYTADWTLGASNTALMLPAEVAVKLSAHASYTGVVEEVGDTRPRARRRGGIYLGPLNDTACATQNPATVAVQHVHPDMMAVVVGAAGEHLVTGALALQWGWGVWSRTDWAIREIVAWKVDNAFDTIRGRGSGSTGSVSGP